MTHPSYRLLRASAGTGKTYQLVQAYVAEVNEHGLAPSEVVAITFTRKAAQELRGRIRQRLGALGVGHLRLAELTRAPISNFHGLALQLLQGFGLAVGLPYDLQVLGDEGRDRQLFVEACEDAWFGGDPAIEAAVKKLAPFVAVDRVLPGALWEAIGRAREDGRPVDGRLLLGDYHPGRVRAELHERLLGLRQQVVAARGEQTPAGRAKIDAFVGQRLPDLLEPVHFWAQAWAAAGRLLVRRGRMAKAISQEDRDAMVEGVDVAVAESLCAELTPSLTLLMDAAWSAYDVAKKQQRGVDFADLVELAVDALAHRKELHQAVRRRYRSVLVDEAQDTNRLQMRFVRLLAGLEGPAKDLCPKASLFLVGDRKQAIYTFRGADPDSFERFATTVQELGGQDELLQTSWRSQPTVLGGINTLGESLFGDNYESLVAKEGSGAKEPEAGATGMTWVKLDVGDALAQGSATVVAEAEAVADYVCERLRAGDRPGDFALLLRAMTHGARFAAALGARGIPAVLGGGGGLYGQAEIEDLTALLAWLCNSRDRLSAAVALRSPLFGFSDSALLRLFGSPLQDDGADGLGALRRGESGLLCGDGAAAEPAAERAATVLPLLVGAAQGMGAGELLELVDRLLDVRAVYLALPGGEQRLANIERLLALGHQYDVDGRGSVAAFARLLSQRVQDRYAEPLPAVPAAATRAVTISTVHQAKGLEFPVVLLANLGQAVRGHTSPLRYEREQGMVIKLRRGDASYQSERWLGAKESADRDRDSELRRLLYVAVTRAKQQVVLFAPAPGPRPRGFLGLLGPWLEQASRDGVLVTRDPADSSLGLPDNGDEPAPLDAEGWVSSYLQHLDPRPLPDGARFELPVTQLQTYMQCLRRGSLRHDLKLPEPDEGGATIPVSADDREPPLDPLSRGRLAHSVLAALHRRTDHQSHGSFVAAELRSLGYDPDDQRLAELRRNLLAFVESALGQRLLALGPRQRRHELPFRLSLPAGRFELVVSGQMDLLFWENALPVVLDFKHAKQTSRSLADHTTQLDAYAMAASRLCGVAPPVQTYLVLLRSRGEPLAHVATAEQFRQLEQQAAHVAQALARHRGKEIPWPGRELSVCRQMGCGYLERCHADAVQTSGT